MENMTFNLSTIFDKVNKRVGYQDIKVEFSIDKKGWIGASMGSVTYFFDHSKLQMVLDKNDFNTYFEDESAELINELLSKHIVNQLFASSGKKPFSEIKVVESDLNQN